MWFVLAALALAVDPNHTALQKALDGRVVNGRVDYAGLKAAPAALDVYVGQVGAANLEGLSPAEEKAFLINAYNALTIDLIVDNYPLASIRDLDLGRVWSVRKFKVAGKDMTLDDIEHGRLRKLGDPRIHAAVNCASIGCPPLPDKVFTAANLDAQLDEASRRWAATATFDGKTLTVNKIFDWYGDDFLPGYGKAKFDIPGLAGKQEAAANFIAAYAPEKAEALRKGDYAVTWAEYDWGLNRL